MDSESKQVSSASVRFSVKAPDAEAAERFAAEAWATGAAGIEECEMDGGVELRIYTPRAIVHAVRDAVAAVAGDSAIGPIVDVPDTDWSEQWKVGLAAIDVSPRLRIRPTFVTAESVAGQAELVIDPGQAFGTGSHESTRLALEWIDVLAPGLPPRCRVLDVGAGTGVLALAAIALTGGAAVGFDLDHVATVAARENARCNELADCLALFTGPIEALGGATFDLVVANLLRREMLPLAAAIAAATRAGGSAVLSGLLERDVPEVAAAFAAAGLRLADTRASVDASGERWVALLMRP